MSTIKYNTKDIDFDLDRNPKPIQTSLQSSIVNYIWNEVKTIQDKFEKSTDVNYRYDVKPIFSESLSEKIVIKYEPFDKSKPEYSYKLNFPSIESILKTLGITDEYNYCKVNCTEDHDLHSLFDDFDRVVTHVFINCIRCIPENKTTTEVLSNGQSITVLKLSLIWIQRNREDRIWGLFPLTDENKELNIFIWDYTDNVNRDY